MGNMTERLPVSGALRGLPLLLVALIFSGALLTPVGDAREESLEDSLTLSQELFVRGDANADGTVSLADIYAVLRYLYLTPVPPACLDAGDFNDSGELDNGDITHLLTFIFYGSGLPPEPYPEPGRDLTEDDLDCQQPVPVIAGGQRGANDRVLDSNKKLEKLEQARIDELFNLGCDGVNDLGQDLDFVRFFHRSMVVHPGQRGLQVPVLLRNELPVDGLTLSFYADPEKIRLEKVTIENTVLSVHRPDWTVSIGHRTEEGYFAFSAFMEYTPPFEGHALPGGCDAPVANLHFSITEAAEPGERLSLQMKSIPGHSEAHPSVINEFSVLGRSRLPAIDRKGMSLYVHDLEDLFVRGDATADQHVDMADTVAMLRYLFLSLEVPCEDRLDVDDDGQITITDPIFLARYLFLGGSAPKVPFPAPGLDDTHDALTSCPRY